MTTQAASLVQETSTTTGTGSYTLAGASTGYRTFASAFAEGANCVVCYSARDVDNPTSFERGIGLLSAATTLERIVVLESSNANAAVNWPEGTRTVASAEPGAGMLIGKNNFAASGARPTSTDNYADGYAYGSIWVTAPTGYGLLLYMCYNPGSPLSPTAYWHRINGAFNANDTAYTTELRFGTSLGGLDDYGAHVDIEGLVTVGIGGEGQCNVSLLQGHGYAAGGYGSHQTERTGGTGFSDSTTPMLLANEGTAANSKTHYPVPADSSQVYSGIVVSHSADATQAWRLEFAVRRVGTANPSQVGSTTATALFGTTGTAPSVGINTTDDAVEITVTPADGDDTAWTFGDVTIVTAGLRA